MNFATMLFRPCAPFYDVHASVYERKGDRRSSIARLCDADSKYLDAMLSLEGAVTAGRLAGVLGITPDAAALRLRRMAGRGLVEVSGKRGAAKVWRVIE